jgi:uncharacterized membrane protein (UPF0136 family)
VTNFNKQIRQVNKNQQQQQKIMEKVPGGAHLNLTLGGLVTVGGIIGYVKKGSVPSLVAGIGIGSMLLGSGYLIAKTDKVFEGFALGSTSSALLAIGMGQRYVATSKMMPAGVVSILGIAGLAYNVNKAIEWYPSSSSKSE